MKFVGLVNSAHDPLMLLKCALYTEEKSTIEAKKKEKKKKEENAKHECAKRESKPHLRVKNINIQSYSRRKKKLRSTVKEGNVQTHKS